MRYEFSIYDLILIVGLTQGLITSFLLLTSGKNVKSSRFLALAIIAFCFLSAKSLLLTLGLWDFPYVRFFPNAAEVVIAPLLYFYLVYLLDPSFKWRKIHFLHFLPFLISQALAIYIYISTLGSKVLVEKDEIASHLHFDLLKQIDEYVALTLIAIYIPLSFRLIRGYKTWLDSNISDSKYPDLSSLRNILVLCMILGGCLLTSHALDFLFHINNFTTIHWKAINILIAFTIYYLGFIGYKEPQIDIKEGKEVRQAIEKVELPSVREKEVAEQLKAIFQKDKVFLNPTLSLENLAKELGVPKRELSTVINKVFEKNFRDLVNDYRVEEVKQNLKGSKFQKMTLLGIAFESGFNSEASFYRIFRSKTGLSPLAYQKMHAQN